MIRGAKILVLFLLVSWTNLLSQHLSHQVIVPVAGVVSKSNLGYSQTVGETAVEVISSSDLIFTQGFQQPSIRLLKENPPPGNGVKVFPNPVSDILTIELFGEKDRTFRIELVAISGIKVMSEKRVFSGQFWDVMQVEVDKYSKGLYFVRIISDDGVINRTFKIDII
jgi:hypothetical protein